MIHWWNRVVLKRLPIEKAAGAGMPHHMAGAKQSGYGKVTDSDAVFDQPIRHRFASRLQWIRLIWNGESATVHHLRRPAAWGRATSLSETDR